MADTYTLRKLPLVPILILTFHTNDGAISELPEAVTHAQRTLNRLRQPMYLIMDLRALKVSIEDVIGIVNLTARGDQALLHHPLIIKSVFVLTDRLLKMGLEGLNSATFGAVRFAQFNTPGEALDHCHALLETVEHR